MNNTSDNKAQAWLASQVKWLQEKLAIADWRQRPRLLHEKTLEMAARAEGEGITRPVLVLALEEMAASVDMPEVMAHEVIREALNGKMSEHAARVGPLPVDQAAWNEAAGSKRKKPVTYSGDPAWSVQDMAEGKDTEWRKARETSGGGAQVIGWPKPGKPAPGQPLPEGEGKWEGYSDLTLKPVRWLWPGYLPRGKVLMLAGETGMGKSQLALSLAATLSRGGKWPDGQKAPRGSVLIISSEDSHDDVNLARLMAANAEISRVKYLKQVIDGITKQPRSFNLPTDFPILHKEIIALGDVLMIIFDPITAYLGNIDSHKTGDVRGAMEPLSQFAAEHDVTVLAISHPQKAAQAKAINAITGSAAFVAVARVVFLVAPDPDDNDGKRRLFVPVKSNLDLLPPAIGYCIEPRQVGDDQFKSSVIVFDQEVVNYTADQLVSGKTDDTNQRQTREDAKDMLLTMLAKGSRDVTEIELEARNRNISWRTVKRAKKELGIVSRKAGYGTANWLWEMPPITSGRVQ